MSGTHIGLYRGVVEEGIDPAARGRLRVSVPAVLGGELGWAERSVDRPGAVDAYAPGTAVWVQFEEGDTDHPVVVGCVPGLPEP
jgi:type VI secretion system (T6SS) baseplate-like injector VgrG